MQSSAKKLKIGYKLSVAIADVSSLVRPGSEIDKAAKERGTSIYFPNTVIPMLPEEISNDYVLLYQIKSEMLLFQILLLMLMVRLKIMIFMKLRLNQNIG